LKACLLIVVENAAKPRDMKEAECWTMKSIWVSLECRLYEQRFGAIKAPNPYAYKRDGNSRGSGEDGFTETKKIITGISTCSK
jgi:hypothetical protein